MSEKFLKMVSELHEQRYLMQLKKLAKEKIPCGIFEPIDIQFVCVINPSQIEKFKSANIKVVMLTEFANMNMC